MRSRGQGVLAAFLTDLLVESLPGNTERGRVWTRCL